MWSSMMLLVLHNGGGITVIIIICCMLKHMNHDQVFDPFHEYFFTYQPAEGHTFSHPVTPKTTVLKRQCRTVVLEVITRSGLNLL